MEKVTPQIKFGILNLRDTCRSIRGRLRPEESKQKWTWREILIKEFPRLAEIFEEKDGLKQERMVGAYFTELYDSKYADVSKSITRFEEVWAPYNNSFMDALSEVNEINWPVRLANFSARASIIPICPRYLDRGQFDLFYKFGDSTLNEVIAHETSHFAFFEKWKELNPSYNAREFEVPTTLWKFSEMAPWIVLGDKRVQRVLPHRPNVYKIWHETKIGENGVLEHLGEIYRERKDFGDFISRGYSFIRQNERLLP